MTYKPGHVHSEASRKKMSESHTDVPLSESHKKALSESRMGEKNPNYGKTFSEDHRRKLSESHKGIVYGPPSELTKKKIAESQTGDKHPGWKGDEVGFATLHEWMRKMYPPPELCTKCGLNKPLDIHNISGEYRRDISDWQYLCRKCHQIVDGRHEKLLQRNKQRNT